MILFPAGLPYLPMIDVGTFRWLLLTDPGVELDPATYVYVDDVSGWEPVDGSYARVTLTSPTRSIGVDGFSVDAADPTFTAFAGGEVVVWLLLARIVTNDADSPIVAAWPVAHTASGSDFTVRLAASGIAAFGTDPECTL